MPAATVDALAAHGAMNAPTMTEVTPEPDRRPDADAEPRARRTDPRR